MLKRPFIRSGIPKVFSLNAKRVISTARHHSRQPPSLRQLHHFPLSASARGMSTMPSEHARPEENFEEERLPDYDAEQFYPVNIGDKIASRYQVVGKLAYGSNSTVWFCRDLTNGTHVVLKVYVRTPPGKVNREISFYKHLDTISTSHPGSQHIRHAIDLFSLERTSGDVHECLVHPPLQTTLFAFQRPGGKPLPLPEELVKPVIKYLLEALDFLHTDANVTHCDLKLSNIMLGVEDQSIFVDYEKAENASPSQNKSISQARRIYASRPFRKPHNHDYGPPILCDFGEARIGADHAHADIQPEIYKAPEILMESGWTHSVDIWNAACLLWEMIEAKHLFDGYHEEGFHNHPTHMHEVVCLLGEPPSEFLQRSPHTWRLFDENGKWKAKPPVNPMSLEDRLTQINGQGREQFLDFMSCMLRWLPEERWTAHQLLQHSWLSEAS